MALLLISPSDIRKYRTLSINIQDERIDPFILEAQEFDLRKVCGDVFYEKLVEEISPANYPELKEQYEGFLIYKTYARLLRHNQVNVTAAGVVYKTNEFSSVVPQNELSKYINSVLDGSKEYERRFIKYMNASTTDAATNYPEWLESDCCSKRSRTYGGTRISAVGNNIKLTDAAKDLVNQRGLDSLRGRRNTDY
jgi:hypothetical protein